MVDGIGYFVWQQLAPVFAVFKGHIQNVPLSSSHITLTASNGI